MRKLSRGDAFNTTGTCPHCGGRFAWMVLRVCPDGSSSCAVAHYGNVCEDCSAEFLPWPPRKTVRKDIVVLPGDPPGQPLLGNKTSEAPTPLTALRKNATVKAHG